MKFSFSISTFFLSIGMLLVSACSNPGYNDNPSQQMTKATVGCLVATDFYAVYFSAYVQPTGENNKVKDRKALFRSFCKDIPTTGKAFFTADLVGSELREMPIAIRIVEQEFTGGDESKAENFKDNRILAEIPASVYAKGVVEAQVQLDKKGFYAIYLLIGGDEALSDDDKIRIPLHVGADPDAKPTRTYMLIAIGAIVGLAIIGFVAYRFIRRSKAEQS